MKQSTLDRIRGCRPNYVFKKRIKKYGDFFSFVYAKRIMMTEAIYGVTNCYSLV